MAKKDKKTTKEKELEIDENAPLEDLLPGKEDIEEGFGKIQMMWFFPEFTKYERSKYWYMSAIIIFVLMLVYAYFTRNPFFAILILSFIILYSWIDKKEPEYIPFLITNLGVVIGDKFKRFDEFESFYIIYQLPGIRSLYLEPKGTFNFSIHIPLENENPLKIRDLLADRIYEDFEKEEMPTSDSISKFLRL